jgi:ABC-2 type transport system ATP-binding protein
MDWVTMTVMLLAAAHHGRIGLIVLGLLVVGLIVYLTVRATARRREQRSQHHDGDVWQAPSAPSPSAPPPSAPPPGAPPPSPPPPAARTRPPRPLFGAATGQQWAVETEGLTKRFGPNVAVDDVSLRVPRGCAFGYLGPNGAGKTTLIRTLLGLTHADSGQMSLLGIPVPAERSRALARVGAIVDEPRFHLHLTGRENLSILAAARGAGAGERIGPSLERVGMTARADDRVSAYSMGMRQRLGVAACLLGDPQLLILDEPMNGLDPAGMQEMRTMIDGLVDEGRTVMLSSHLLDEVERTCDAVAIVDRGRLIRQGSIDELVRRASRALVVECSDAEAAARLIGEGGIALDAAAAGATVTVRLPEGATRDAVAEIVRRLVNHDISVYGVQESHSSLEDWFLSVTSRFGAQR